VPTGDHHSAYLAKALAALTPAGHERVDELTEVVGDRRRLVRFARARREEADAGRPEAVAGGDAAAALTRGELQGLLVGFRTIRDEEPLDDVADWANAVLALLEDEAGR